MTIIASIVKENPKLLKVHYNSSCLEFSNPPNIDLIENNWEEGDEIEIKLKVTEIIEQIEVTEIIRVNNITKGNSIVKPL